LCNFKENLTDAYGAASGASRPDAGRTLMTHFQVTFSKSLLSSDGHPFKCAQQVIDLDALDAEAAVQAAKRRFEYLHHLRNWRVRADFVDVSEDAKSGLARDGVEICGSLRFQCPVTRGDVYSGIDTDASTLACIAGLTVRARCPSCRRTHVWRGTNGILGQFAPVLH
jgi:hypothetical protein